MGGKKK